MSPRFPLGVSAARRSEHRRARGRGCDICRHRRRYGAGGVRCFPRGVPRHGSVARRECPGAIDEHVAPCHAARGNRCRALRLERGSDGDRPRAREIRRARSLRVLRRDPRHRRRDSRARVRIESRSPHDDPTRVRRKLAVQGPGRHSQHAVRRTRLRRRPRAGRWRARGGLRAERRGERSSDACAGIHATRRRSDRSADRRGSSTDQCERGRARSEDHARSRSTHQRFA